MPDLVTKDKMGEMLIPESMIVQPKFGDDGMHERMAGSGFLPRIQLLGGTSKVVQKGMAKIHTYVVVRGADTIVQDLGQEFSALVLHVWRPKAVHFGPKTVVYYNPKKAGFQNVEKEGDKKPRPKGFMYGPEYLLYLPSSDEIVTMHFNNPTMRMRAGEMKSRLGRAATFRVEVIEKDGNIWPAPIITVCSTPLDLPQEGTPERESWNSRVSALQEKFANPPDEEVEEVAPEEAVPEGAETRAR